MYVLSGDIREPNADLDDPHGAVGHFDRVLAKPLFGQREMDRARLVNEVATVDARAPFGLPTANNCGP